MSKYSNKELKQIRSMMKISAIHAILTTLVFLVLIINYFVGFFHLHIRLSLIIGLIFLHVGSITLFIANKITLKNNIR